MCVIIIGLKKYGRNWKKVEQFVRTRCGTQIRSHAQKYFLKLQRAGADKRADVSSLVGESGEIPRSDVAGRKFSDLPSLPASEHPQPERKLSPLTLADDPRLKSAVPVQLTVPDPRLVPLQISYGEEEQVMEQRLEMLNMRVYDISGKIALLRTGAVDPRAGLADLDQQLTCVIMELQQILQFVALSTASTLTRWLDPRLCERWSYVLRGAVAAAGKDNPWANLYRVRESAFLPGLDQKPELASYVEPFKDRNNKERSSEESGSKLAVRSEERSRADSFSANVKYEGNVKKLRSALVHK